MIALKCISFIRIVTWMLMQDYIYFQLCFSNMFNSVVKANVYNLLFGVNVRYQNVYRLSLSFSKYTIKFFVETYCLING